MTEPGDLARLCALMDHFDVVQLAHQLGPSLPQRSGEHRFVYRLHEPHDPNGPRLQGQMEGSTGAADTITLHLHGGTPVDSLAHVALNGRLFDGSAVFSPGGQSETEGVRMNGGETMRPIVGRGVLLDFAELLGAAQVPDDYVVTAAELSRCAKRKGVSLRAGDVVLLRTGRDCFAGTPAAFYRAPFPGIDVTAARALATAQVVAAGSDTFAFEASGLEVPLQPHVELISRAGVFIMEMLDLRELAARGSAEFFVVVAPLRITGATGSPVNPLAFVRRGTPPSS